MVCLCLYIKNVNPIQFSRYKQRYTNKPIAYNLPVCERTHVFVNNCICMGYIWHTVYILHIPLVNKN